MAVKYPWRFITGAVLGAGWKPPGNSTFLEALPWLEAALKSDQPIEPLSLNLGAIHSQEVNVYSREPLIIKTALLDICRAEVLEFIIDQVFTSKTVDQTPDLETLPQRVRESGLF